MRLLATVLALAVVQVMGLPTPQETPALTKIPKPGINLKEVGNFPYSDPAVSQVKTVPTKISPKPVVANERVFPLAETENEPALSKNEPAFPLKEPAFPQREPAFPSEGETALRTNAVLASEKSSVKASEEHTGSGITQKTEKPSLFSSSPDSTIIDIPPASQAAELVEDVPSIRASVDSIQAAVPSEAWQPPQGFFEESDGAPVDQGIVLSVSSSAPLEDDSLSLAIEVDGPEPVLETLAGITPQVALPVVAASLPVSEMVVASPVMIAIVPDAMQAPDPPMPTVDVPFVGGQYRSQDEAGQYSFSHWGGSHTRTEVKNMAGVVAGSFAYLNPEGEIHVRKYVAEPLKGFRVAASDLPSDELLAVQDVPAVAQAKAAHAELVASLRSAQGEAKTMST